jgi:hypothetical protein
MMCHPSFFRRGEATIRDPSPPQPADVQLGCPVS